MTVQTAPVYERLASIEERFEELERLMGEVKPIVDARAG